MNKRPFSVIEKLKCMEIGRVGISSITVSELWYGVWKSRNKTVNEKRLEEFLAPFDVLPYDEISSGSYGLIRSQLEEKGLAIGPLDMLIAAHALSLNRILVTNNEREFKRVPMLTVENWV